MKLTARNRIPNTDLEVSPLCLGTMTFGVPVVRTRGRRPDPPGQD